MRDLMDEKMQALLCIMPSEVILARARLIWQTCAFPLISQIPTREQEVVRLFRERHPSVLNSLLHKVEQMEPVCSKQDGMVCRVCGQRKYLRKEWFHPQWQEWSPVVLGHQGGDFDTCKTCYYNTIVILFHGCTVVLEHRLGLSACHGESSWGGKPHAL